MEPIAEAKARETAAVPEVLISQLLRSGVFLSVAVIVAGMLVSFLHHPSYVSSAEALQRLTRPERSMHTVTEVVEGITAARGQAIVMLGLLLLVSIPVTRVMVSLFIYVHQRDWRFVLITATVLMLLLLSFSVGAG